MLKNISSLGKTLNKEQQQSINGGSETPWQHPHKKECTENGQPKSPLPLGCLYWFPAGPIGDDEND